MGKLQQKHFSIKAIGRKNHLNLQFRQRFKNIVTHSTHTPNTHKHTFPKKIQINGQITRTEGTKTWF